MKKKLESDIAELESAVESANEAVLKSQRTIKQYQAQLKELQGALEAETLAHEETKDARLQVGKNLTPIILTNVKHKLCFGIYKSKGICTCQVGSEIEEMYICMQKISLMSSVKIMLCSQVERRANALANELDESRTLLEQTDRARREAEKELAEGHESILELEAQADSLSSNRRKLEAELQTLHSDLEEILREARASEEKAQRTMLDAARLSDELRAEQEHAQLMEKERKSMELMLKDLQIRVNEAEANALKAGKKTIAKLEERIRQIEAELDTEQRRHGDAQKNLRKGERQIRELTFQADEDRKNHERMQDLVDKLQQKIRSFQRQVS